MEPHKKYPAFLKPYLADCSNRMQIHPSLTSFMKSSVIVLRNYKGKRWPVEVEKIGDNLYFQAGWRNFIEDNYIEFGDLLVFDYKGENGQNIFDLKNLGKMASEKHILEAFGFNRQEEKEAVCIKQEPADDMIKETTPKRKHLDISTEMEKVDEDNRPSKKTGYMNGNPYFVIKIMRNGLGELYVLPSELMNDKGIKLEKFMTVHDHDREWHSKVSRTKDGSIMMKKWELICTANRLNVGDEFVCEIVAGKDGTKPYIQVHINRTEEKLPQERGLDADKEWPSAHVISSVLYRHEIYGRD